MKKLGKRFQIRHQVFTFFTVGLLAISFQNCSGFKVGNGNLDSSGLSSSAPVSVIPAQSDQTLHVTNVNKEILSSFDPTSTLNSETFYTAVNPATGRRATVRVFLDQSSHVISRIEATGPSYFCFDPRQSLCANVTIPFGYPGAGTLAPNCSSPIYYTGAIEGSVDNLQQDNICSTLTSAVPLNATPWRRSYQGAYSAFVTADGTANAKVYTINGTENKNYLSYQNNPSAVSSGTCDQNTINAIPCAAIQGANEHVPGAPKSSGVWNGVYNDYNPAYHSFNTMSVRNANAMNSDGEFLDLGPIAWPANGYLAEDQNGKWTEDAGGGMGLVTGTSVIDKAGQYVYVFYADRSHGISLPATPGYAGRGSGMKVVRAPILGDGTVDPGSFKSYYNGTFSDSALPQGFQKERIQDFYSLRGGRSDDIFGTPLKVYIRFNVANIANSAFYIGASLEDGHVLLRTSSDLVHWNAPFEINSLASTDPAWWKTTKMLNTSFLDASGTSTSTINLNDFYLLGTDTTQAHVNKVHLQMTIDRGGQLAMSNISAVGTVNFQGDAQPLETVPSLIKISGQQPYLMFATDWTSRCPINQPLTGAVTISNSSCRMSMQSDLRKNNYFPLGVDPTTTLNVTNINNEIQGTFNSLSINGSDTKSLFTAVNPASGRSARLLVSIAPTTRAVLGARPADYPYFCYDHSQPACANVPIPTGYPNAGTLIRNCSSPIYLAGALNGTINNLTTDLSCGP